jgi:Arc/MetJ-type ribon-helix-helix transcriptional regulator
MGKVTFNATVEATDVIFIDELVENPTTHFNTRGEVVQTALKALKKELEAQKKE